MTAGAILAGGQSRRFGSDKGRAIWRGRSFIRIGAEILREVGCFPILLVGGVLPGDVEDLEPVADCFPGEGPLGAIVSALSASCGDTLVLACDMVRADRRAFSPLLGHRGSELAVVPVCKGELQPLCALYRAGALAPLAMAFAAGQRSVERALVSLGVAEIPFADDAPYFANVNTTRDLEELES